jgi:hypothetical protein
MKRIILLIFCLFSISLFSQTETSFSSLPIIELNNKIRLSYLTVPQPVHKVTYDLEPKMGFAGLNYYIPLTDWLYTGAGFHTAVTGDQGGLFTLGVNLGTNLPIYKNLFFDANVHIGGGGGYRTLVNGGGIIIPNIGLQYKKNNYSFGIQYTYVNFFTGIQKGENISFFLEIPTKLRISPYKYAQQKIKVKENSKEKKGVKSVQQVKFDFFFPRGLTRTDASTNPRYQPITQTLYIIGFEYQRYLTPKTFVYTHLDTMYKGLTAGFMDLFFGVGTNFINTKYINFFAKAGIGAAGGRIYPENGLTMYPSIGTSVRLSKSFGISAHTGYHRSIGATFEAITAGFSLKYYGLSGGNTDPFSGKKSKEISTRGIGIAVQDQYYEDVAKFGIPNSNLKLVAIKIIYDLSKRFYVSGEASFAYKGKSGGYAHGIFGLGIRSNKFLNEKVSLYAEAAAGVAGGGRVDSGEGVLIRPNIGINYHINNNFSLNASGGQMWSPFGNVNSLNANFGFTYNMAFINAKK